MSDDTSEAASGSTEHLLHAAGSAAPAQGLRAVSSLRALADRLEELQVERARREGWSWQQVADALGVTRQAVHKKYGKRFG